MPLNIFLQSDSYCSANAGPLNVMIPFTIIAGITSFVWPLATTQGSLIVVSVVYGYVFLLPHSEQRIYYYSFAFGAYISVFIAPVFAMGEVGDVGRRTGMFLTVSTLGLLIGPPISGTINGKTGHFRDVGYYAGVLFITSFFHRSPISFSHLGSWNLWETVVVTT